MSLTPEQLEMRRKGITGTDIGAICGLSEHRSPLDVWLDKTGRAEPLDVTPAMERGMYLERGMLDWYAARTQAASVESPGTLRMRGQPTIMATPDAVALFGSDIAVTLAGPALAVDPLDVAGLYDVTRVAVEVKCPGPFMEYGWGDAGTDQVPAAYLCQGVFEMAVLDVPRVDFAALLGGELRIFPVKRDTVVEGKLIERALAFWRDHVEKDVPPPPTWRDRDMDWIQKRFPRAEAPPLQWDALTPEQRAAVHDYLLAHEREAQAGKELAELEARVKLIVAGASGIEGLPLGLARTRYTRIDWRQNQKGATAWKMAAELQRDGRTWGEALAAAAMEPARPFVPRKSKKGDE